MAVFSFQLESFQITQTRSEHLDTDYVASLLVVNPEIGIDNTHSFTRSMGDLNNGIFTLDLLFPAVTVNPKDVVVFNYLIVNSGHKVSPNVVEAKLQSVCVQLAAANLALLPAEVGTSALQALAPWLKAELASVTKSSCDGAVAVEQSYFRYEELISRTASGPFNPSVHHAGTRSPGGCGKNSAYVVNWQALDRGNPANVTVPVLTGNSLSTAENLLRGAGLAWTLPGKVPTNPQVTFQRPVSGTIVSAGSAVALTLDTAR